VIRKELLTPIAQLVADRRPGAGDLEVADVVGHEAGARLKMVRSLPRCFISFSWLASIDSRSSSSLIFRSDTFGRSAGSWMPAICRLRQSSSALGAVV
jgi:hypothetical protein